MVHAFNRNSGNHLRDPGPPWDKKNDALKNVSLGGGSTQAVDRKQQARTVKSFPATYITKYIPVLYAPRAGTYRSIQAHLPFIPPFGARRMVQANKPLPPAKAPQTAAFQ